MDEVLNATIVAERRHNGDVGRGGGAGGVGRRIGAAVEDGSGGVAFASLSAHTIVSNAAAAAIAPAAGSAAWTTPPLAGILPLLLTR